MAKAAAESLVGSAITGSLASMSNDLETSTAGPDHGDPPITEAPSFSNLLVDIDGCAPTIPWEN